MSDYDEEAEEVDDDEPEPELDPLDDDPGRPGSRFEGPYRWLDWWNARMQQREREEQWLDDTFDA